MAKDWHLEFRSCDVVTHWLWLYENNNYNKHETVPFILRYKKSDNESFESQTETEGSTDNEDIAEQSSVVQPHQFEPVADSDYEEEQTDDNGILRETLEARFKKNLAVNSW